MSKITIQDLASELGLSKSTISRALNNQFDIRQETRARVMELARKWNYVPDPASVSLKTGKSHIVAMVVPDLSNSFFSRMIEGAEAFLASKGYSLMIFYTHEKAEKETLIFQKLQKFPLDGLLVAVSLETRDYAGLEEVANRGVPVVCLDRCEENWPFYAVLSANRKTAAHLAARLLLQDSPSSLVFLGGPAHQMVCQERKSGFDDAQVLHSPSLSVFSTEDGHSEEGAFHFFSTHPEPFNACFFINHDGYMGYRRYLKETGKTEMPSAVFLNDVHESYTLPHQLFAIAPGKTMGSEAAWILYQRMNQKSFVSPQRLYVPFLSA